MDGLERLLQEDLNHLLDRIASATTEGTASFCLAEESDLASRLGEAESRLSAARLGLLEGYIAWQAALKDCSDLWALAAEGDFVGGAQERRAA